MKMKMKAPKKAPAKPAAKAPPQFAAKATCDGGRHRRRHENEGLLMSFPASCAMACVLLAILGSAALTAHSNQMAATSAPLFAAIVLYAASAAALGLGLSSLSSAPTGHRPVTTRRR